MTPQQLTGKTTSHLTEVLFGQKVFLIHRDVEQDLLALRTAAVSAGFNLNIASGFRDFERQRAIWNNKMAGNTAILDSNSQPLDQSALTEEQKIMAILRWSALPGASRHHWGCEFDVFDRDALPQDTQLKLEPWEYLSGHQSKFYQWLQENLNQFGFFFPYANDLGGVAPEPWHISHQSVSQQAMERFSLAMLRDELIQSPICGQQSVLDRLESIYNHYITNIHYPESE
ncbi:M15 family metallopeptidase [Vibrio sp. TRT 17S01]|uniref:M15 family metallopeptidase n=1 Tax=Vibrio sp. TRT 17S01 TaxID=3418505 RepID=UPI003CE82D69